MHDEDRAAGCCGRICYGNADCTGARPAVAHRIFEANSGFM